MSENRITLEVVGPSVEEALADGLAQLGVTEDQVDYEILDEGGSGFLGFGNRQARLRLTVKGEGNDAAPTSPAAAADASPAPAKSDSQPASDFEVDDATENIGEIAVETVRELLEKMEIHHAEVSVRYAPPTREDGDPMVIVDVNGKDLGILIGRRAENLNALQLIARMIVGKEAGQGVNLMVDVAGYRERRVQNLETLAEKVASQVASSGRAQSLEPMPAAERRIIHITLKEDDRVYTESEGQEPRRKVRVIPAD